MTVVPPAPPGRLTGDSRRWTAAREEYLAGATAEAVCRRHDLRLSTFRRYLQEGGWRRMDQPEPEAPAPEPPPAQDGLLVIPEAPQALSGTEAAPLTATQMVDKCWAHVQAAVAAGRLIEARGWLRLYKDLKPIARFEEIEAREARMEREATERREAEAAQIAGDRLVIPQAPQVLSGTPLHCFSASESHEPPRADDEPIDDPAAVADAATPISTSDLVRLAARIAAISQQVEQAVHTGTMRLPLHSFSPEESHDRPVDDLDQAMRDIQTEILSLKGSEPLSDVLSGAP
ncbi:hypothetical protein [Brevundimonas sp.]|uniref:hypothetical protein n=1 Tax=Brevundimonas sp. TaxID=1871086 RepID=UPI00391ACA1C